MTESPSAQVFIANAFKREARHLKKRYRTIEADLQSLIEQLQNGDLTGDRIPGFADIQCLQSPGQKSDIRKGKSGGYRVIYQSLTPNIVVLLYLYAKSDQDDVTPDEICAIIEKFKTDTEAT